MTIVNKLDMFYETRTSLYVNRTSPTNSANTELKQVPLKAEIRYQDHPSRVIDGDEFDAPNGKGFETARFLVSRAMMDPDATVVPV